ncbi:MAG: DMT family transporter [Pseudomonas stutzeri]|uniref:DMT family transporter n=1 Tax=Stutzerimonas stutzeri TaxID=316 RepID=UPI0002D7B6D9|nr:DMT family transporter [Stutzerimonas stutzeri]MDH0119447.1 DMT family transporter [Stutzerimonas stutzeri]MTI90103.1 DMT family transporter [Stutzerimonas stutzeri]
MNSLMPQGMLIGGAIMWGLGWLPLQFFAARGLAGMPLVLLTYSLLSLLALPVLWQQRRQWASQYRQVLTIGLCGGWATAALVTALAEGNVVRVMLLFYLAPVWAMVGGWLLLGERLSGTRLFALGLAMLGIGLTLGVTSEALTAPGANDWLALSAGLAFSLNNLATRAADRVPLASKALVSFVGSALLGGLFCLLLRQPLPPLDLTLSWQIALLALGWLVSMAAVQYGLTHLEAGRAAVLVVFELIAAVLSSAWFGSHAIGPNEWLGAALITTAALIAGWPERPLSIATRSTCA